MSFENYLFSLVYSFTQRYVVLSWLASFFGQYLIYFLLIAFILFLLFKRRSVERLYLFCLGLFSVIISRGIITELIRFFYYRPRPFVALNLPLTFNETSGSLPSGHLAFLVPLALLVWFEDRVWGKWFVGLTLLIGLSRVALGLHWPSDIVLGIVVGGLAFYLTRKVLPKP